MKNIQEEFEDKKGIIRDRTQKKDIQEELEDTNGVNRGRTPNRTDKKSLKMQKE